MGETIRKRARRWFAEMGPVRFFAGVSGFGGLLVVADGRRTNVVQFVGFSWARKVLLLPVESFSVCKKRKIQANKSIRQHRNIMLPS
jgi:hypothetical protein